MIRELILRRMGQTFKDTQPMPERDSVGASGFSSAASANVAGTCLPGMTGEVLELAKELKKTISQMLAKQNIQFSAIEVRQRLSTKDYRLYVQVLSCSDLEHLSKIERVLIAEVQRSHAAEVSKVFWRFAEAS